MTDWNKKYYDYFEEIQSGITDQCRQHDKDAHKWHNYNWIFMVAFAVLSGVMVLNGPLSDYSIMPWIMTFAGALNAGLMYTYGKVDPMAQKAAHIRAIASKSSIADRIKQELLQKSTKREDPDEFLSWILKDLGTVSDASPYLWMGHETFKPFVPELKNIPELENDTEDEYDETNKPKTE